MTSNAANRAEQLDALRGYAVTTVILSLSLPGDGEYGSYGVYLFFVLSGYLITRQLLGLERVRRQGDAAMGALLGGFYLKRVLRLFPAVYTAIVGAALVNIQGIRQEFWWHAGRLSNVYFAFNPENDSWAGHFWSLA